MKYELHMTPLTFSLIFNLLFIFLMWSCKTSAFSIYFVFKTAESIHYVYPPRVQTMDFWQIIWRFERSISKHDIHWTHLLNNQPSPNKLKKNVAQLGGWTNHQKCAARGTAHLDKLFRVSQLLTNECPKNR